MVAMETGHFLKKLSDASLASLGLLMWKVLGCLICKKTLWVLSYKVNPIRCHTKWSPGKEAEESQDKYRKNTHIYVWYDGISKQSGGGQASIS